MGTTAYEEGQATLNTLTPINPTIPRLSSSRTPHQILPQIQTMTLILTLLEPSPSGDADEWEEQSSSTHYTIGLSQNVPQ